MYNIVTCQQRGWCLNCQIRCMSVGLVFELPVFLSLEAPCPNCFLLRVGRGPVSELQITLFVGRGPVSELPMSLSLLSVGRGPVSELHISLFGGRGPVSEL